ncbi:Helicase associated domain protein [Oscillospiraceae bacterium 50-60]
MAGILYPHNAEAYQAVTAMLAECGKAAIVHPTGTGKSLIGFQLCQDHPDASVCWLSPSEYIFRTQLENWRTAGGGELANIRFFTYARLMLLREEELTAIAPDYIILDEFHRCGAEQWGQGVRRLRERHPKAGVLGLSATNVRYLDNQRDMANELFDGNIASEMTLGEAITRGILNPPRYVLTVFSMQNDLKKYEDRIRHTKSTPMQDQAKRLLDMLRRALEQADGLDVIFEKHIRERTGKYIAFCANLKHMDEMISHVTEWFGGIDPEPHIYRAYSEDPAASKAFAEFKADASEHLKLLFCIDMLNEGIHVENVSGVILFRPTVSPIIYKQQIGRAMSVGKTGKAVIFDVVNNIENLYSISAMEAEMQDAAERLRFYGEGERIICESFRVIDEVRDCRRLFDELEDTLTASWEMMYQLASRFFEEHGHLRIPRRYRTQEGYALGNWLMTQRKVRAGRQYGRLSRERIARLDAIGMEWDDRCTVSWNIYYNALCIYRQRWGDLDIPADYVTGEGLRLGAFIANLRAARSAGSRSGYLTRGRVEQLDTLGMIWNKLDYLWERNYLGCVAYYLEHHDLDIPAAYISPDGQRLGAWIRSMRRMRSGRERNSLTEEQIKRLDTIGMIWEDAYTRKWEYGYGRAVKWYEVHKNLDVPTTYVDEEGFALGKWLRRHTEKSAKTGRPAIRVTPERKAKLDMLGMCWEKEDPWEMRYQLARQYYEEHGSLNVPGNYVAEGVWLNKWLNEQKQIYRGGRPGKRLSAEQTARLEQIGMTWRSKSEEAWEARYEDARRFFLKYGHLSVPKGYVSGSGKRLDSWLRLQRRAWKNGGLSEWKTRRLEEIGMDFHTDGESQKCGRTGQETARTIA